MIWRMLLFVLVPFGSFCQANQRSDILMLKKGHKNLAKYFEGSQISFYTTEGMPVQGIIDLIKNDSIYLHNYKITRIPRSDGGVVFDTSGRFKSLFSVDNIGSFPVVGKQRGKNLITDGTLMTIGSAGYLGLNLFNTLRDGDPPFGKDNRSNVITATTVLATGYLLSKVWPKRYILGKKYSIKILKS